MSPSPAARTRPAEHGSRPARSVAVVGAGGPTGYHLTHELLARGRAVRVIGRRREALERAYAGTDAELATADAREEGALVRALGGCELVVDCIGLPPQRMDEHPATARAIVAAARAVGARTLQVSSYWSFFPHRGDLVSERHPRVGGHAWFRRRREAEDVFLAAGAAVVHLPDFFGPRVHTGVVQRALEDAAAGRPVAWIGGRSVEREAAFVPDAMRIVADLAERDEAYGSDWALPGSGTLSAERLADLAAGHLGRPVALRTAPAWLLLLLSLGNAELRAIRPLIAPYARPVRYDAGKLRALLGDPRTTPLQQAVATTLDWLGRETGARPSA